MPRDKVIEEYGVCGYEDTQSGEPCTHPAYYADGRCSFHTDVEETQDADSPDRVSFRTPKSTHERIKAHNRESETLSATIDRALDALEREDQLPNAVTEVLREDE